MHDSSMPQQQEGWSPPEPAWVRWWRANPIGKPYPHVETKGKRKRTKRERKAARR